ncbi:hypothetical protein ACFWZ3_03595 [Frateuria sp. GZRR35]|uniref:hypothetical protein n=1 Tax=unclassified Frateuria TaxID=2648894 RepID=UPI003EDC5D74
MQCKLFCRKSGYFTRPAAFAEVLQREVNDWLAANPSIRVVHVLQSSSGGSLEPTSVTVSVWYEGQ